MKTENQKFYNARLASRAKELIALADEAGERFRRADDAVATCNADDARGADELIALYEKRKVLAELFGEAERLAFNAERASYYAERGDLENISYFTSFDPFDY